jgi:hypothetical protein
MSLKAKKGRRRWCKEEQKNSRGRNGVGREGRQEKKNRRKTGEEEEREE